MQTIGTVTLREHSRPRVSCPVDLEAFAATIAEDLPVRRVPGLCHRRGDLGACRRVHAIMGETLWNGQREDFTGTWKDLTVWETLTVTQTKQWLSRQGLSSSDELWCIDVCSPHTILEGVVDTCSL